MESTSLSGFNFVLGRYSTLKFNVASKMFLKKCKEERMWMVSNGSFNVTWSNSFWTMFNLKMCSILTVERFLINLRLNFLFFVRQIRFQEHPLRLDTPKIWEKPIPSLFACSTCVCQNSSQTHLPVWHLLIILQLCDHSNHWLPRDSTIQSHCNLLANACSANLLKLKVCAKHSEFSVVGYKTNTEISCSS